MSHLNCGSCERVFTKSSRPVKCVKCDKDAHKTCAKLDEKQSDESEGLNFICVKCAGKTDKVRFPSGSDPMSEIKKLNSNMDSQFNSLKTDIEAFSKRVTNVETAVTKNSATLKSHSSDMAALQEELRVCKDQIRHMSNYGRKDTIEVHGVPEDEKENLFETISDIGKVVGLTIEKNHISAIHRIPSRRPVKPIIVKFCNRWVLDQLMNKRRGKTIKAADLGYAASDQQIFISASLPKEKAYLAMKTRLEFKKRGCFVKVEDNGDIMVGIKYEDPEIGKEHKKDRSGHLRRSVLYNQN